MEKLSEFGVQAAIALLLVVLYGACGVFTTLPIVSIVVPFVGLTNFVSRILKGNPNKELPWRL